jgi:hypothetical protein
MRKRSHMDPSMSALEAIELSEAESRTVNMPWSMVLAAELEADADGMSFDSGNVHEFWGHRWTVRLHKAKGQ